MDELLLPYVQIRDFLPQPELAQLLDYVLSHPQKFKPATVGIWGPSKLPLTFTPS